jgi:hypothetical protein
VTQRSQHLRYTKPSKYFPLYQIVCHADGRLSPTDIYAPCCARRINAYMLELKIMDITTILLVVLPVAVWLWLSFIGTIAARFDSTLDPFQKKGTSRNCMGFSLYRCLAGHIPGQSAFPRCNSTKSNTLAI